MVIFSTCFKTDRFSPSGASTERKRREKQTEREKEMKKREEKKKTGPHTTEGLPGCVCVPACAMWTSCGFLCLHTAPPRELWPGADGRDTLQNTKLDPSHCVSAGESITTLQYFGKKQKRKHSTGSHHPSGAPRTFFMFWGWKKKSWRI